MADDPNKTVKMSEEEQKLELEALKARTSGNRAAAIERWLRVIALGVVIIFGSAATYVLIADVIPAAKALEKANNQTADQYPALVGKASTTLDLFNSKVSALDVNGVNQRVADLGTVEAAGVRVLNNAAAATSAAKDNLVELQTTQIAARKAMLDPGGLIDKTSYSLNDPKTGAIPAIAAGANQISAAVVPLQKTAEQFPATLTSLNGFLDQGTTLEKTGNVSLEKFNVFLGSSGVPDGRGIPRGGVGLNGFMSSVDHSVGMADEEATNLFHPVPCATFGCRVKRGITFVPKFIDFGFKIYNEAEGFPVKLLNPQK